jgi:hypothetical protein
MFYVLYPFVTHLLTLPHNNAKEPKTTTYFFYIMPDIIKESLHIFSLRHFLLHYFPEVMYTSCVSDYVKTHGTSNLQNTKLTKLNSVACSPQANYTDRAAATCQRS